MSFRTRLVLIITGAFIAAGAGLLTADYFIVVNLFAAAIQATTTACGGIPADATPAPETGCSSLGPEGPNAVPDKSGDTTYASIVQQSTFLSNSVISGLVLWSIVLLVVFAAVAAGLAFWLARRSLSRIGDVTDAARAISERDLGRRLDLPGPNDEIKKLGDTFDDMLDRLQLAFAAQDRFVANASHELRTPLTTTRAALEIPMRQGDVPPELQPAVRRALRATEQSERLITALLSLTRGRRDVEDAEQVDLAGIVTEQLDDLAEAAAERRVKIERQIESAPTTGNPVLLERAVRNLVENGIRHNLKRGGRMRVLVGTHDSVAFVEVENTGAVLDAAAVALLTEPFYRGEVSRMASDDGGFGLGLAIVDSIALTHDGRLTLTARDGGGLIARLDLMSDAAASHAPHT